MSERNATSSIYFDIIDAQNWSLMSINIYMAWVIPKPRSVQYVQELAKWITNH